MEQGGLTCVRRLVAGSPSGQQGHAATDGWQVIPKDHPVSLEQPEPGIAGHQPSQSIIGTAGHGRHQFFGDLGGKQEAVG